MGPGDIQSGFEPRKRVCGGDVSIERVGEQVCIQPWGCQTGEGRGGGIVSEEGLWRGYCCHGRSLTFF